MSLSEISPLEALENWPMTDFITCRSIISQLDISDYHSAVEPKAWEEAVQRLSSSTYIGLDLRAQYFGNLLSKVFAKNVTL